MKIRNIFERSNDKNIKAFPSIDSVFESECVRCREIFFPVCSIKLGKIKKEWAGEVIHLIQYNEDPYNTETTRYFNDYCRDNMIAFDLNNGKYKFKTDLRYFDLTEDWKEWFNKTKESYNESKNSFVKNGNQFGINELQLGGDPEWWQADATPLDPDGNPMEFITEFETDSICDDFCGKKIFLFYSPRHKLAVQVYQIT